MYSQVEQRGVLLLPRFLRGSVFWNGAHHWTIPDDCGFMLDIGGPRNVFVASLWDSYHTIILYILLLLSHLLWGSASAGSRSTEGCSSRQVLGLAFGASGTMSNSCSESQWHPSLRRGSQLELFCCVSTRNSCIFKLHFSRRVTYVD